MPRPAFLLVVFLSLAAVSGKDKESSAGSPIMTPCTAVAKPTKKNNATLVSLLDDPFLGDLCPPDSECSDLSAACLVCQCPVECVYGRPAEAECTAPPKVRCNGDRTFKRTFTCQYCFQSAVTRRPGAPKDYTCEANYRCDSTAYPPDDYTANCTVRRDLICLGRRQFLKRDHCNWTGGFKWSTTLALSITLGGFGADK